MSLIAKSIALACATVLICSEAQALKRTKISRSDANTSLFACGQVPGSFPMNTSQSSGCCFEDTQNDKTYCTMCNNETEECYEVEDRQVPPKTLGQQLLNQTGPALRVAPATSKPKPRSSAPVTGTVKKP